MIYTFRIPYQFTDPERNKRHIQNVANWAEDIREVHGFVTMHFIANELGMDCFTDKYSLLYGWEDHEVTYEIKEETDKYIMIEFKPYDLFPEGVRPSYDE